MGNEMGNNNVSGIQEQENIKVEATNTHSDTSISAGDEIAENKPVSSTKEEHDKHIGLSSEEPPHMEKESSDGREPDETDVQAYDETSETPLQANDKKDHELLSGLSSADECLDDANSGSEKNPSSMSKQAEVHSYDGMQKSPLLTNDTKEQETVSTLLARDGDGCVNDADHKIQRQIKSETPLLPNATQDHEVQSPPSSADGCLGDTISGSEKNPSSMSNHQAEVHTCDGMQTSPLLTNGVKEQETESTLLARDECVDDTDHRIQKHITSEREGEEMKSSPQDTEYSPQDPESIESVAEPSQKYWSSLEQTNEAIPATNGPRDTKMNEHKLEDRLSNDLETNAFSANMSNNDESTIEIPNEVDGELNADEKEDGTDKELLELNLLGKNFSELETEVISLAESQEVFQGESTDLQTNIIVPFAEPKLAEKIVEIEPMDCEADTSFGSEIKAESQSDDAKASDNGYRVGFHNRKHSLACEETVIDLEKETMAVAELQIESIKVTNIEGDERPTGHLYLHQSIEKVDAEDKEHDNEETGKVKNAIPSYCTDPADDFVPTSPTSLDQLQDGRHNSTLLESQMQDNLRSLMLESNQESFSKVEHDLEFLTGKTSMQVEGFDSSMDHPELSKQARLHDSNTGTTTLKDDDISDTGSNQEVIKSPIPDAEDPSEQSGYKNLGHNPMSNKKVTDESNAEQTNNNAHATEAPSLILFDVLSGDSSRSPPLVHQENTLKSDDLSNGKPIAETDFAALEPLNCHEPAEEKQVIALETTDPEKLKAPILNLLKEENHNEDLPKKQEGLTAEMVEEEKRSSSTIYTKHPEKEKRKPRYSLFSNCICCTTVTP